MDKGNLQINVFSNSVANPVPNSKVSITDASGKVIETLETNQNGSTERIQLDAPPVEYTQKYSEKPYTTYNIQITADGFLPQLIEKIQIISSATAISKVTLETKATQEEIITVKPHTLWGTFPPKIPEAEEKPLPEPTGFMVLDTPVIPETIVVHGGLPDEPAPNYFVPFKDYIKNVASCEIYPTWPRQTLEANILAILSFTVNRVFTVITS